MTGQPSEDRELWEFIRSFRGVLQLVQGELMPAQEGAEPLVEVLDAHLGVRAATLSVLSEQVPGHRRVDADIALTEIAGFDPSARLIGIGGGEARHHLTLGDLLQHGLSGGGLPVGQVDYLRLDTGPRPSDVRQVVTSGVWLFRHEGVPVAVRVQGANPQFGREEGSYEVLAPQSRAAEALVARLRVVMDERSILRGQVVAFASDPYGQGQSGISFLERPTLGAPDVVLPAGTLERIEHHVVGIGRKRAYLTSHGQHLKRGILLYGPPGTGKTHTVRYLLSQSPGTTAVLLSGGALGHIHTAAKVARAHQPAIVVLEDVDLVAEDRSYSMGPQPLLFEVLDALDGLDSDADVAFLLTTNRVADLELALTQRPGRVDLAAEIPLPDIEGRQALMGLYGGHLFGPEALTEAAERSAGTTASFVKELVRRAVLAAAVEEVAPADRHLAAALDELLSDAEALTRSLLGTHGGEAGFDAASDDPDAAPERYTGAPVPGLYRGRGSAGWFAHAPHP